MAMNKKEKALLESLQKELEQTKLLLAATTNNGLPKVEPDIPPPSFDDGFWALSKGYTYNVHSKEVTKACSSTIGHSTRGDDKTTSQRPIHLYSSELLAYKAMRYDIEQQWLNVLGKIDKRINALTRPESE